MLTELDGALAKTAVSLHEGVGAFARGCFMAIRNPGSHSDEVDDLDEYKALEQLAAFSLLARWIDDATLDTAP